MKKITAILALLLLSTMVDAKDTEIKCKEDGNQIEMNQCAYDDFKKADKELNRVYQELRKARKDDKLFLANLKKAQRAWLTFRDLELKAQFSCKSDDPRECFGSMYNLSFHGADTELINQRIKTLKGLLDEASL